MNYTAIARKTTLTLFFAQSLGSAGFIAVATVTSIVGASLSGSAALAGLPSAIYLLGQAVAAFIWGDLMERLGRRWGLSLGIALGVVGAGLAAFAVVDRAFFLFLIGLVLMGVANAALTLGRFAAAEVHPPEVRGRAISNVVIGGTVGAVTGPLLVGPAGQVATRLGFDELAGAFAGSLGLFALAALIVFIRLRPDPREVGREIARLYPHSASRVGQTRSLREILRAPAALIAILAMVFGQMVMVMLMVITALHMKIHQHPLTDISVVISSHSFGMYAFSILSGRFADQWGRAPVILIGAGTLVLASLFAPFSSELLPLSLALFLLGLGWNFCYVGGSSLLSDQLSPAERARTQGFNDFLVGLASAVGSLGSGFIFAAVGFGVMGLVAAAVALAPFLLTFWWQRNQRQLVAAH